MFFLQEKKPKALFVNTLRGSLVHIGKYSEFIAKCYNKYLN